MKIFFYIILFLIICINIYPSITVSEINNLYIPSKDDFEKNREITRSLKLKKITVAEYLTDPLILYVQLWGTFALTINLWEDDEDRGFDKLNNNIYYNSELNAHVDDTYAQRLKMEPFATGRMDPVTKPYLANDGQYYVVFRNDFYIKNIIEPISFIYMGLYLRSKNYHPAIMITEIILLSLLYELTIRPFYLSSSFEQFLKNPAFGIIFGIFLDEISTYLLTTPYIGLHVLAYILNPFNALPNSRIHPMLFFQPYKKAISIEAVIKLD